MKGNTLKFLVFIFVNLHHSAHLYSIKQVLLLEGKHLQAKMLNVFFIAPPSKIAAKKIVQSIREKLKQEGRDPYSVKIYTLLSIVTDETDKRAQEKFKEYQSYGKL